MGRTPDPEPKLLAMAAGSETRLCFSPVLEERTEGNWPLQIPSQTEAAINQEERKAKALGPRRWGQGGDTPRTRLCSQSIPPSQRSPRSCRLPGTPDAAVERMAATGWSEAIIARQGAAGGVGGWARHQLGALGPQLAEPSAVAGGEGCGGRPGAGLRCPGAVDQGTMPCVSGGGPGRWHLRLWPAAGLWASTHRAGEDNQLRLLCRWQGVRVEEGWAVGWSGQESQCSRSVLAKRRTQALSLWETTSGMPASACLGTQWPTPLAHRQGN
jgi:hypothetical protein